MHVCIFDIEENRRFFAGIFFDIFCRKVIRTEGVNFLSHLTTVVHLILTSSHLFVMKIVLTFSMDNKLLVLILRRRYFSKQDAR